MKKRVSVAFCVMLVAATRLIAWRNLGKREPTYQGRSLAVVFYALIHYKNMIVIPIVSNVAWATTASQQDLRRR